MFPFLPARILLMYGSRRERIHLKGNGEIQKRVRNEVLRFRDTEPVFSVPSVELYQSGNDQEVASESFFRLHADETQLQESTKDRIPLLRRLKKLIAPIIAGIALITAFVAPHAGHIAMVLGSFAVFGVTLWNVTLGVTLILSIVIPYLIWRGIRKKKTNYCFFSL
mgnify:CR=1 FL=1